MRPVVSMALMTALIAAPALAQQRFAPPSQAQVNAESDVVLAVKQRLANLGYDVKPDSQFDAALRNNVIRYQADAGLRPTGNVDLSTLASLGIDVDPAGSIRKTQAQAESPRDQQAASAAQPQPSNYKNPKIPFLRDENMTSPQYLGQGHPVENQSGLAVPDRLIQTGQLPGFSPGYSKDDLKGPWD